jgi:hypothetical protein
MLLLALPLMMRILTTLKQYQFALILHFHMDFMSVFEVYHHISEERPSQSSQSTYYKCLQDVENLKHVQGKLRKIFVLKLAKISLFIGVHLTQLQQ